MQTVNKDVTTEDVVEIPTPFDPPLVVIPHIQLMIEIKRPKIIALQQDFKISVNDNTDRIELKNILELTLYNKKQIKQLLDKLVIRETKFKTGSTTRKDTTRGIIK